MKSTTRKLTAALLAVTLTASVLTGCAKDTGTSGRTSKEQTNPSGSLPPEDNAESDGSAIAFRPSDNGMPVRARYEYPYMGMTVVLSEGLRNKMEQRDVIMLGDEAYLSDSALKYAAMSLYALTEEQKNETVTAYDPDAWKAGLEKLGAVGVYHKDTIDELDTLTGCTVHKELGKSADGNYFYYLSVSADADSSFTKELTRTELSVIPILKPDFSMGKTAFSEARVDAENVGDFRTTDISGKEYTKELFGDYDLTLVNVFTTWCNSCIEEMPELEQFKKEMAQKGINIIGIVYDTIAPTGKIDEGTVETAKLLQEKAGITFPLLIPDAADMNGRLQGIDSYPESFFVDRDGNIVGEKYMGTHSFAEWKSIAEKELRALKGEN